MQIQVGVHFHLQPHKGTGQKLFSAVTFAAWMQVIGETAGRGSCDHICTCIYSFGLLTAHEILLPPSRQMVHRRRISSICLALWAPVLPLLINEIQAVGISLLIPQSYN